MAKCDFCNQEMSDAKTISCIKMDVEYPDETKMKQSTYHFDEPNGRCHDCNIKHGGYHHPGCDVERCPKCNGQLISCGCLEDEDYE